MEAASYGHRMQWGSRPALLVVDATVNFCGQRDLQKDEAIRRWPNACGPAAWRAVDEIADLIEASRRARIPIFYTIAGFRTDGWNLGSWRWKQPRSIGDAAGSPTGAPESGNAVVAPLRPRPEDVVIEKLKPSAFFETPLRSLLSLCGIDTVIVTGGSTSGCVRGTVLDAFSHNLRVIVPEGACFDRVDVSHAISLFDMNAKYADVVQTAEVLSYLSGIDPVTGRPQEEQSAQSFKQQAGGEGK
jgi:nicotinamidase-related amidase